MPDDAAILSSESTDTTLDTSTTTETVDTTDVTDVTDDGAGAISDDGAGGAGGGAEEELVQPGADGKYDARTLPKAVQQTLKSLRETNPQIAKTLNDAFFRQQELTKTFPGGLAEARQVKESWEALGGTDGVAKLQESAQELDNMDQLLADGNPDLVKAAMEISPQGVSKLVPAFIDALQKSDAAAYAETIAPHVMGALESAGFVDAFNQLYQAVKSGNDDTAMAKLNAIAQWYNKANEAVTSKKTNSPDPERQRFEQERTQFQKERENTFRTGIAKQVGTYRDQNVSKALAPFLKSKPLSKEGQTRLVQGINGEIERLLRADKTYMTNIKAMVSAKDRNEGKIVSYGKAAHDRIVEKAVQTIWKDFYGDIKPVTTRSTTTKPNQVVQPRLGGNTVPIQLAQKPKSEDIDWDRDPRQHLFMGGKAYLKNGKFVQWRKDAF